MIQQIKICDRCGNSGEAYNNRGFHIFKRKLILTKSTAYDTRFDLCQNCYDSLEKWYKEGKKED